MGNGKSLNKALEELRKANTLVFGGPVVLQGPEVLKARKDTVRLSQLAGGTLELGVIGDVGQFAFELAANPFPVKKKKKKRK